MSVPICGWSAKGLKQKCLKMHVSASVLPNARVLCVLCVRYSDGDLTLIYSGGEECSSGFQRMTVINFECSETAGERPGVLPVLGVHGRVSWGWNARGAAHRPRLGVAACSPQTRRSAPPAAHTSCFHLPPALFVLGVGPAPGLLGQSFCLEFWLAPKGPRTQLLGCSPASNGLSLHPSSFTTSQDDPCTVVALW